MTNATEHVSAPAVATFPLPLPGSGANTRLYRGQSWDEMRRVDKLAWIHDLPNLGGHNPLDWRLILTTNPQHDFATSIQSMLEAIESGFREYDQIRYSLCSVGPVPVFGIWLRTDSLGRSRREIQTIREQD